MMVLYGPTSDYMGAYNIPMDGSVLYERDSADAAHIAWQSLAGIS